jgi:hypothetical protein
MNEQFSYIIDNISLYTPDTIEIAIGSIIGLAMVIFIHRIFLYGYGSILVRKDQSELRRKKETLSDLILMKDIQTELEKEIEQAMLKATFQG